LFATNVLTINDSISVDLDLDCVSANVVDVDDKVRVTASVAVKKQLLSRHF